MADPFKDKWAILIGPTEYQYVKTLRYCAKDVTEIGARLRDTLEFPDDHILEFGVGLKFKPELTVVYNKIGEFLKNKPIKEDDLLLFYFSGHGINDKKDYLLPVDATPYNLKKTGLEVEDLVDQLTATKCNNVVMFIDACREAIGGAKGANAIGEESKGIAERSGVMTFFSCDPRDLSYEIEDLEHGSFTYCLLEALKSRQYVTAAQIYDYLVEQVPLINKKHNKPVQKPYAVISPDEKRQMQLFYSSNPTVESTERWKDLRNQLADYHYAGWLISIKYFTAGIEILAVAEKGQLRGDDAKKLDLIERLCAKDLTLNAFAAAWDAIERRGSQHGKAVSTGNPTLGSLS